MFVIEKCVTGKPKDLFTLFYSGFDRHNNEIAEIESLPQSFRIDRVFPAIAKKVVQTQTISSWPYSAVYTFLVQSSASLVCFFAAKFASKTRTQKFGMALPLNLIVPVSLPLLVSFCQLKQSNSCIFHETIPPYLYWYCPEGVGLFNLITKQFGWFWIFWVFSQAWITRHNWTPRCVRLALTERLFVHPYYSGLLIDQSVAMNRRRDDYGDNSTLFEKPNFSKGKDEDVEHNRLNDEDIRPEDISDDDKVTRIYVCATMWHEEAEEMVTFFKSVLHLDKDQSARRKALDEMRTEVLSLFFYFVDCHIEPSGSQVNAIHSM